MKIKCIHCAEIYLVDRGSCPACGKYGGYLQEPKMKTLGDIVLHLEDILVHKESKNEFQIKEIQTNGLICEIVKTSVALNLETSLNKS